MFTIRSIGIGLLTLTTLFSITTGLAAEPIPPSVAKFAKAYTKRPKVEKQKAVGMVVSLKGKATITSSNGRKRPATLRSPIFIGDKIETSFRGFVQVDFLDRSKISLAGSSDFEIKDYEFDGERKIARSEGKINNGALHFMAGKIAKIAPQNYKIETATATIGIRGSSGEVQTSDGSLPGVPKGFKLMKTGGIGVTAQMNGAPKELPVITQSGRGFAVNDTGKVASVKFTGSIVKQYSKTAEKTFAAGRTKQEKQLQAKTQKKQKPAAKETASTPLEKEEEKEPEEKSSEVSDSQEEKESEEHSSEVSESQDEPQEENGGKATKAAEMGAKYEEEDEKTPVAYAGLRTKNPPKKEEVEEAIVEETLVEIEESFLIEEPEIQVEEVAVEKQPLLAEPEPNPIYKGFLSALRSIGVVTDTVSVVQNTDNNNQLEITFQELNETKEMLTPYDYTSDPYYNEYYSQQNLWVDSGSYVDSQYYTRMYDQNHEFFISNDWDGTQYYMQPELLVFGTPSDPASKPSSGIVNYSSQMHQYDSYYDMEYTWEPVIGAILIEDGTTHKAGSTSHTVVDFGTGKVAGITSSTYNDYYYYSYSQMDYQKKLNSAHTLYFAKVLEDGTSKSRWNCGLANFT